MRIRAAFTMILLLPAIASAAMNKCQDASGRVTYTDAPCAEGQTGGRSAVIPDSPAPAPRSKQQGQQPRDEKAAAPYRRPERVEVPPLPKFDPSVLPKDAQGRPILNQTGSASLVLEKTRGLKPVNVLAACSALVSRCYKPGERDLDACFMSAPRCTSDRPWEEKDYKPCCPTTCWNQYEAKRIAGASPLAAFDKTLFGDGVALPGCIPGK